MRCKTYYPSDYFAEITRRELNPYDGRHDEPTVRVSDAEKAYDKYYVAMGMHDFRVKFKGGVIVKFEDRESADRLAHALNNLRRVS